MVDEALKVSFAKDVCLLHYIGIRVVVVHGGGPQIDATLSRMGIQSKFEGGLRVTDEETMKVVEMVLAGSVNSDIVGLICGQGGRALGLSGRDDGFIRANPMSVEAKNLEGSMVSIDLGRVGAVTSVSPKLVSDLCSNGFVPVISPIGVDVNGSPLNVNADLAASAIAQALGAAKLILMTDVAGVLDENKEQLTSLNASQAKTMIASGSIRGGMIPKVECALEAVNSGVEKVHIIDGRQRHALLLEIFTDSGVGTEIHRDKRP
jgi:acetylglutamate kinase